MAKELMREFGNKSREFYEFVMPALDMYEDGSDLVILIDLPGFSKQDISLRILDNILSINAKRQIGRESKYGHSLLQAETDTYQQESSITYQGYRGGPSAGFCDIC